ncbi:MAG: TIGR04282 family arsenosugar biosynthesis glycosyltransferase [Planctomycetaceae bacterium]|nr:TIGR04282 family arsenosugar biosynthesis glycosyltransferase [Planctomycetaceae bacterium]
MKTIFGVFAKQPIPGQVKTRLAASIGADAAASIYAAFLGDIIGRFADIADHRVIAFSPADPPAEEYFRGLAHGRYELWTQSMGSLGERMSAFFVEHLQRDSSVVLIGSDSPSLPRDLIDRAFDALETHDCVIGPATDGGYYLIGLRRWTNGLFDDVAWGGSSVLTQTVQNLTRKDFSLQVLPPWYDVDTLDDLLCLSGHLTALHAAGQSSETRNTERAIEQWMHDQSGDKS